MADANITVKFGASGAEQAAAKLSKVTAAAERLGNAGVAGMKAFASAATKTTAALGAMALAAGGTLAAGIKKSFDAGAQLHKLASSLGEDAGQVSLLAQAFKENGMSADSVGTMVTKLQRKVAEGSDAFKTLGMSAESLKGKSAADQMDAIGTAIRGMTSQEDKMHALMKIFEEAGPQLMQFFNNPNAMGDAAKTLGSSVDIMSRNAAAFERASTLFGNVGTKVRTFFDGAAQGLVAPLTNVLEQFNSIDFAAIGEKFGDAMGYGIEIVSRAFASGQLGELVCVSLEYGFQRGCELAWDALSNLFEKAKNAISGLGEAIGEKIGNGIATLMGYGDEVAAAERQKQKREQNTPSGSQTAADRLKALTDSLMSGWMPPSQRESGAPEVPTEPASSAPKSVLCGASTSANIPVDALRRIGGYIGGTSGAFATQSSQKQALRAAQRTEDYTQRTAVAVERLASQAQLAAPVAVYA